jgi:hypothetical protein
MPILLHHNQRLYVLGGGPLATTTTDTNTVDNIALLSFVSETASFVRTRGPAGTVNDLELAKLLMHSQLCSTSTSMRTCKVPRTIVHTSQHCDMLVKSSRYQLHATYADTHQEAHHI